MRKFFVLVGILSFGATVQPMGTIKEKISNWYECVDVSEKLHTAGSFLNNGMNRLVDATIHNDSYTTKEKITVCGGAAVFLTLLTTSRILKQKSINNQLAQLKNENADQNLASSRSLTEEEINRQVQRLSEKLDIEYTLNGVLNNLSSGNIANFDDFLTSLNDLYSHMEDFLPSHQSNNQELTKKCKDQLDKEVKKIVDLVNKKTNDYNEVINNVHLKLRLKQYENAQQRRKFNEQLEDIHFAVKHPPISDMQQA